MAVAWSDGGSRTWLGMVAYLASIGVVTKATQNRIRNALSAGRDVRVEVIDGHARCWVDGTLRYEGDVPEEWAAALAGAV